MASPSAASVAREEADDRIENGYDAVDNRHDDTGDTIDDCHDNPADGTEAVLDAGHNSAHVNGCVVFVWGVVFGDVFWFDVDSVFVEGCF